ncbi:MAG TPA: RluA family pseudouridine synthase [Verrucomicrobiae bacterium]|jgi:23S rRNA pseudouridine1911/1915/1917 synthase|nr:RluA family pseudouridine synthase [Verrucomicrobiae bacterium]
MPGAPEKFVVDVSLPQERLDVFLHKKLPDLSRAAIQRLMLEGHIRVDGRIVKPTHHPRVGETIAIERPAARPPEARAEEMPLAILYEDEELLVLNKPAGMVVHPAAGHLEHTLVNALLHHCRGQLSGIGGVARPGIVHRLDKDTSGCLIVAKTDAAHLSLSEQFAGRQVEKTYQAIVCGRMPRESGSIETAISRHPTQRKKMAVTDGTGRAARTTYRVLERWRDATFVEVALHTGRTHQIRVHFAHLGFPVAGDLVYGRLGNAALGKATGYSAPRQLLHAWRLGVVHPSTREQLVAQAPPPEDFLKALDFFRRPGVN